MQPHIGEQSVAVAEVPTEGIKASKVGTIQGCKEHGCLEQETRKPELAICEAVFDPARHT